MMSDLVEKAFEGWYYELVFQPNISLAFKGLLNWTGLHNGLQNLFTA